MIFFFSGTPTLFVATGISFWSHDYGNIVRRLEESIAHSIFPAILVNEQDRYHFAKNFENFSLSVPQVYINSVTGLVHELSQLWEIFSYVLQLNISFSKYRPFLAKQAGKYLQRRKRRRRNQDCVQQLKAKT